MSKKILIAFDDSENAQRAVGAVAETFARDSYITLFSVVMDTEALCKMNSPALTPYFKSQQSAFCTMADKKKELVETAMQQAKETLMDKGFEEKNISTKSSAASFLTVGFSFKLDSPSRIICTGVLSSCEAVVIKSDLMRSFSIMK